MFHFALRVCCFFQCLADGSPEVRVQFKNVKEAMQLRIRSSTIITSFKVFKCIPPNQDGFLSILNNKDPQIIETPKKTRFKEMIHTLTQSWASDESTLLHVQNLLCCRRHLSSFPFNLLPRPPAPLHLTLKSMTLSHQLLQPGPPRHSSSVEPPPWAGSLT